LSSAKREFGFSDVPIEIGKILKGIPEAFPDESRKKSYKRDGDAPAILGESEKGEDTFESLTSYDEYRRFF
jgi:hypothetical protein